MVLRTEYSVLFLQCYRLHGETIAMTECPIADNTDLHLERLLTLDT